MRNVLEFLLIAFLMFFVCYVVIMAALVAFKIIPIKSSGRIEGSLLELYRTVPLRQFLSSPKLSEYDRWRLQATHAVIIRYARGNVLFQGGLFIDEEDIKRLSVLASRALRRLTRRLKTQGQQ